MRNSMTFMLIATATLVGSVNAGQDQNTQAQPRKIEVTAKKFEFDVPRIEAKVGETVELTLNSLDAKHGFECKELGIKKVTFESGKPAKVTFTATKAGTYEFKCANFCGMGHGKMKGQIIVSP
jgi:cytochrome c oxidase subunit II